ncbi:MAG TPA: lytic transglycosylase domain-containing protein [Solirubrobacteraceae bacterium]|jgi:soluble lytic murein transglycosylase|nr:lytic transglycosylase domain-containing protein [Solirubrobacteraceae bacterium]
MRTRHRNRGFSTLVGIALAALAIGLIVTQLQHAQREPGLPLRDASIIRRQAAAKQLDPALIAAVIYAESKFEPRTSSAGALGLMQILPETADFIAGKSGGVRFTTSDLATPAINLAYGSWYLRYLLNHYNGRELPAIAAYNAGLANVDRWLARAGGSLAAGDIPFPETQAYVQRVIQAQHEYRASYPRQLGYRS